MLHEPTYSHNFAKRTELRLASNVLKALSMVVTASLYNAMSSSLKRSKNVLYNNSEIVWTFNVKTSMILRKTEITRTAYA